MRCPRFAEVAVAAMLLCLIAFPGRAESPEDTQRRFLDAVTAYRRGDYPGAVKGFLTLTQQGIRNGKLYYNLGNAYLRDGNLGRAVLWYERAAVLLGRADPELRFNRTYAQTLVVDQLPETRVDWGRVLLFWRGRVSRSTLVSAALAANAVLWSLLALHRVRRRRALRRCAVATAGVLLVLLLTLGYDAVAAGRSARAVILPSEVAVRSGTSADTTELFRLHAGSLVDVEREQEGYVQIRFGADAIGWIPAADVGRIGEQAVEG